MLNCGVTSTRDTDLHPHNEEAHAVHGNTTYLTPEQLERIEKNRQRALQRRAARRVEDGLSLPAVDVDPGSIPAMPTTFHELSHIDMEPCSLLQRLHPHPRDDEVIFKQSGHLYFVRGHPTSRSVTALIHEFAQPFDADMVIQRMRTGKRWPRAEYIRESIPADVLEAIRNRDLLAAARLELHISDRVDCRAMMSTINELLWEDPSLSHGLSMSYCQAIGYQMHCTRCEIPHPTHKLRASKKRSKWNVVADVMGDRRTVSNLDCPLR